MLDIYKDITTIIHTSTNLLKDLNEYLQKHFLGYVDLQDIKNPTDIVEHLENVLVHEMSNSINYNILTQLIPGYKKPIYDDFSVHTFLVDNKTFNLHEFITYLEDKYFYIQTINKINKINGRS